MYEEHITKHKLVFCSSGRVRDIKREKHCKRFWGFGIHSLITSNLVDSEREREIPAIHRTFVDRCELEKLSNIVCALLLLPFLCSVLALFSGLKLNHLLYFSASCSWCLIGTSLSIKGDVMRLKFLHRIFQNHL